MTAAALLAADWNWYGQAIIWLARAGDWDDNGVWRILHAQTWDANHPYVNGAFKNLGKIIFDATEVLNYSPTPQQAAEARFLRAFAKATRDVLAHPEEAIKFVKERDGIIDTKLEVQRLKLAISGSINTPSARAELSRAASRRCARLSAPS